MKVQYFPSKKKKKKEVHYHLLLNKALHFIACFISLLSYKICIARDPIILCYIWITV